ncbi:hypothetical protein [Streptosporangium sp. NPDC006930]|uniref:hypothetical protein n=1 Tax=unclassified Streptosporangium TaxID=2632669 RepID=UPI0034240774
MTKRDVRPGTPYISEENLPDPFEGQDFLLGPGVHLHWSLPDALTRLVQEGGKTRVPVVPNRWLVTRRREGVLERSRLVESDYLAAPDDANAAGIAFPVTDGGVPFRRLGRAVPLGRWRPGLSGDRLPQVTAIGCGDPTFAAFYPGCHSVFGFHDTDFTGSRPPSGTRYEVAGWFSAAAQDTLADLTTGAGWRAAPADGFGWGVPDGNARPASTVCYASLIFRPDVRAATSLSSDPAFPWTKLPAFTRAADQGLDLAAGARTRSAQDPARRRRLAEPVDPLPDARHVENGARYGPGERDGGDPEGVSLHLRLGRLRPPDDRNRGTGHVPPHPLRPFTARQPISGTRPPAVS